MEAIGKLYNGDNILMKMSPKEYEESPLQWLRYMGPARFKQLRKCFLKNGGSCGG